MIYTSYFGKIRYIKEKYPNLKMASISNKKPNWLDDSVLDWSILGPSKELLYQYKYNNLSEKDYEVTYRQYINNIWENIKDMFQEDIVVLCYEKTGFCHRHILSDILNQKGIESKELE